VALIPVLIIQSINKKVGAEKFLRPLPLSHQFRLEQQFIILSGHNVTSAVNQTRVHAESFP